MLLVVFIVLINYNEFSSAQPQFPALRLPKLTVNVEKVDVHIKGVRVHSGGKRIPRVKKESGGDYAGGENEVIFIKLCSAQSEAVFTLYPLS